MNTAVKKEEREQVFAMWKRTGKKGTPYFIGKLGDQDVRGFYNTNKKNLKEPDLRIYSVDKEGDLGDEIVSLWCNATKSGKKVLSGTLNGAKVVGFINETANEENKRPYFSVYWSKDKLEEEKPESEKTKKKKGEKVLVATDEDVPF